MGIIGAEMLVPADVASKLDISHNFAHDTIDLRRHVDGQILTASIPRSLCKASLQEDAIRDGLRKVGLSEYEIMRLTGSILRPGTAMNDCNTPYGYRALYNQNAAATNAYQVRKSFPRSEQDKDAIMIRRVNARLRIAQDKHIRHLKHVAIVAGVVVFAPLVIAAILRMWGFALAWIAS